MSDIRITQLPVITEINDSDLILVQTDNDTNTIKFSDLVGSVNNTDTLSIKNLNSSGKVGIGTSTPDSLLHVSSETTGDAKIIIEADTDNNNEDDNPFIIFRKDGGLEETAIWSGSIDNSGTENDNSLNLANATRGGLTAPRGGIKFLTTDSATVNPERYPDAVERMTITPAGKVGIGNKTPTEVLTITGNLTASGNISSDSISVSGNISSDNLNKITSHQNDTLSSFEFFEAYADTDSQITAGNAVNVYKASVDTCGGFTEAQAKYTFCSTGYYAVNLNGITDTGSSDVVSINAVCNNGSDVCIGRAYAASCAASDFASFNLSLMRLFNKGETLQLEAKATTDIFGATAIEDSVGKWTIALIQRLNG